MIGVGNSYPLDFLIGRATHPKLYIGHKLRLPGRSSKGALADEALQFWD
jgi:hypothetical protein